MDLAEPLTLPPTPEPARRPPIPKLAALVPVAAGIAMWAVTGSLLALCFAALGPLMMLASVADGIRQRRREQRRAEADAAEQWRRADAALARRHAAEREALQHRHPDVRTCLEEPPLGEAGFGAKTMLVLGRGTATSTIRVSGGDGERAERFRARAALLDEAPVAVELGGGICIRGARPVTAAVARALLIQLCTRFRATRLTLAGDDALAVLGLDQLPHARPRAREAARLAVAFGISRDPRADAVLCLLGPDDELPEGVTTVVECEDPTRAQVRSSAGVRHVHLDALSRAQAQRIAAGWAQEAGDEPVVPVSLTLSELSAPSEATGLLAVIGRGERGELHMDLVADGPHAIVTGMTGAGKSELLITWVTAIAQAHAPEEVNFVLADFKGGTAFDPLRSLPHVAAVITDLDEEGAQRGVQSLRAELRRREEVLAAAGARDVADPAVELPRLVIVVDEFAALLHEHPDLGEVFTDIAARGRALGMHLILGTQRAAGVIREALAANCPLRLSLRVTDAADSRTVLGVGDAAELPGDAASRGLAIARRPRDDAPHLARVALTSPADLERARRRWEGAAPARSPWLPALPSRLDLAEFSRGEGDGALVVGLADEPSRQRQSPVLLRCGQDRGLAVFGGPQSGKSSLVALLAAQRPAELIGPDPEAAWDAVTALAAGEAPAPPLLLIDDLDALIARYPAEYAQAFAERAEQAVRRAATEDATVVVTASRVTGAVARIADLLPQRALLALPSRADHLAAGGTAGDYLPRRAPGRAHLDGREVQFALASGVLPMQEPAVEPWRPSALTAVVCAQPQRMAAQLRESHPDAVVSLVGEVRPGAASDPLEGHDAGNGLLLGAGPDPASLVVLGAGPSIGTGREPRQSQGEAAAPPTPSVLVGDGEAWQRQWALWQRLRAEADIVVSAECTGELRTLLGMRELPPYALSHAGRAWWFRAGARPVRVLLEETGSLRR